MTDQNLPSQNLRDHISTYCDVQRKGGTAPLIMLELGRQHFHKDFIEKVLADIDKIPMRVAVGDMPTDLEKFAYELLSIGCFAKHDHGSPLEIKHTS